MKILEASDQDRKEIINLLQAQKMPAEDLPVSLHNFFTAIDNEKIIGLIGLEIYNTYGLLRSMVVHPDYRNKQIAEKLVQVLEQKAAASGIHSVFLLTETAEKYFIKKGYEIINRNEVPNELFESTEFSHVCPVSAIAMVKHLTKKI